MNVYIQDTCSCVHQYCKTLTAARAYNELICASACADVNTHFDIRTSKKIHNRTSHSSEPFLDLLNELNMHSCWMMNSTLCTLLRSTSIKVLERNKVHTPSTNLWKFSSLAEEACRRCYGMIAPVVLDHRHFGGSECYRWKNAKKEPTATLWKCN